MTVTCRTCKEPLRLRRLRDQLSLVFFRRSCGCGLMWETGYLIRDSQLHHDYMRELSNEEEDSGLPVPVDSPSD